eukprot:1148786-Pelagomonas_calceolata.AAC.6
MPAVRLLLRLLPAQAAALGSVHTYIRTLHSFLFREAEFFPEPQFLNKGATPCTGKRKEQENFVGMVEARKL